MREMFAEGVKKCDATEEIGLYVPHGKCTLNQCANLVSGLQEQNFLYGKGLLEQLNLANWALFLVTILKSRPIDIWTLCHIHERAFRRRYAECKECVCQVQVGLPVGKCSRFCSRWGINIPGDILIQTIEGKSNGDIFAPFFVVGLEFVKFLPRVLY